MSRLFDDAASEYLYYGDAILTAVPITMAAWVYKDDDANNAGVISIVDESVNDHYFQLQYWSDETVDAGTRDGGVLREAISTAAGGLNTWIHACGVFAAANSRSAYLNGGNKGTNAGAATPANLDNTTIGARISTGAAFYTSGSLAEAAIWNAALTDIEVWYLAQGFPPPFIRPQALVGYWPLVRGDQDRDWKSQNYNMTAFNTPDWYVHPPKILAFWERFQASATSQGSILQRIAPNVWQDSVRGISSPYTYVPRPPAAYNTLAIY